MKAVAKRLIKFLLYSCMMVGLVTLVIPIMLYIMFGIEYLEFVGGLIDDI